MRDWTKSDISTLIATYHREFTPEAEHKHTQEWLYDVGKLLDALMWLQQRSTLTEAEIGKVDEVRDELDLNRPIYDEQVRWLIHIIMRLTGSDYTPEHKDGQL